MRKTDVKHIQFAKVTSNLDRRCCRKIILATNECIKDYDSIIVSCSGGLDSSVLVHTLSQALRISGQSKSVTVVYLNHHLRPDQVELESAHVKSLSEQLFGEGSFREVSLDVTKGSSLQVRARNQRYAVLADLANETPNIKVAVLTAHHANDVAETKLFQLLTGRPLNGIPKSRSLANAANTTIVRPFLSISRIDLERYAKTLSVPWCHDRSNDTLDYSRNKIRHDLIPWIEANINPGVVKTLSKC